MGIFGTLKNAAVQANEEAHGIKLANELADTALKMKALDPVMTDEIIQRFIDKRTPIQQQMFNWTDDGKLKMASTIRKAARDTTNFNMIEGYALWMTSAWLESSVRQSAKAIKVFDTLNDLANASRSLR